jgi:hypothetical protein
VINLHLDELRLQFAKDLEHIPSIVLNPFKPVVTTVVASQAPSQADDGRFNTLAGSNNMEPKSVLQVPPNLLHFKVGSKRMHGNMEREHEVEEEQAALLNKTPRRLVVATPARATTDTIRTSRCCGQAVNAPVLEGQPSVVDYMSTGYIASLPQSQPPSPHQELQQCMHGQNDNSVWQPAPQSGVRCLDIVLWAHDGTGEVLLDGQLKAAPPSTMSYFKHQHALNAGDILKMHVEGSVQLAASIGFAGQAYDPSRHTDTCRSTSWVSLGNGNAYIMAALGEEGVFRSHVSQLHPHASHGALNDVSLRCDPNGNVPQIQFNEDGVWHDWFKDRAALKAGPWFPYLQMYGACLSNFRVESTKQMTLQAEAKQLVPLPQAAAFTKEEEDEEEEEEKDALSHPN